MTPRQGVALWLLIGLVGFWLSMPSLVRRVKDIDLYQWTRPNRHARVMDVDAVGTVTLGPETYGTMILRLDDRFVYRCLREMPASAWACERIDRIVR